MFGLDRRIFLTFKYLIFRPGKLTKEFIKGDVRSFTPPTTLYFTINLLFFLILPIVNSGGVKLFSFTYGGFVDSKDGIVKEYVLDDMRDSGLTEEVYQAHFDSFIKYNQPALIFVIIPFLIILLRLINVRNQTGFLSHTVYAFHLMSFYLVSFLFLGVLVNLIVPLLKYLPEESISFFLIPIPLFSYAIWFFYYLFKSLRVVYKDSLWIGFLKSIFLLASMMGLLFLYIRFLVALSILNVN